MIETLIKYIDTDYMIETLIEISHDWDFKLENTNYEQLAR